MCVVCCLMFIVDCCLLWFVVVVRCCVLWSFVKCCSIFEVCSVWAFSPHFLRCVLRVLCCGAVRCYVLLFVVFGASWFVVFVHCASAVFVVSCSALWVVSCCVLCVVGCCCLRCCLL